MNNLLAVTDPKIPDRFRFVVFDGRRGVAFYQVSDGKLIQKEWLVQFSGYWYISGANPTLSPNGRWIYLPLHADTALIDIQTKRLHWLGRARRLPEGGYIPEVYRLRWSPNSRYLLGQSAPQGRDLILCQPLGQAYRVLVKDGVYGYGWYPDSRHIWYVQKDGRGYFQWYRRDLQSGRVERLRASERQRINSDWDLTLGPFRWMEVEVRRLLKPAEWTALMVIACTADRQLRVLLPAQNLHRRMLIEWRNGHSVVLEAPPTVRAMSLWDLSADKQWALVWSQEQGDGHWYVVHLERGHWERLVFSAEVEQALSVVDGVIRADFEPSARLLR
ncbi:MAG: hypothetical protein WHS44_08000 [Fimbriimonadales bacterium]|nr:MAG: hypothetical protein KatS3mg018_0428 [Fimbriimonadales bacterium]